MFACGDSGVRVATFFEKLAHFLALALKVGLVTTKAPLSGSPVIKFLLTVIGLCFPASLGKASNKLTGYNSSSLYLLYITVKNAYSHKQED